MILAFATCQPVYARTYNRALWVLGSREVCRPRWPGPSCSAHNTYVGTDCGLQMRRRATHRPSGISVFARVGWADDHAQTPSRGAWLTTSVRTARARRPTPAPGVVRPEAGCGQGGPLPSHRSLTRQCCGSRLVILPPPSLCLLSASILRPFNACLRSQISRARFVLGEPAVLAVDAHCGGRRGDLYLGSLGMVMACGYPQGLHPRPR